MVKPWAVIYTLAVTAGAVGVQGTSLVDRIRVPSEHGHAVCQTSGGSPLVSDCEAALSDLNNNDVCTQTNKYKSHCTTLKRHGTCKINVCGQAHSYVSTLW